MNWRYQKVFTLYEQHRAARWRRIMLQVTRGVGMAALFVFIALLLR